MMLRLVRKLWWRVTGWCSHFDLSEAEMRVLGALWVIQEGDGWDTFSCVDAICDVAWKHEVEGERHRQILWLRARRALGRLCDLGLVERSAQPRRWYPRLFSGSSSRDFYRAKLPRSLVLDMLVRSYRTWVCGGSSAQLVIPLLEVGSVTDKELIEVRDWINAKLA